MPNHGCTKLENVIKMKGRPWGDRSSLLSTGWKLVSFRPSKPVANSICGTEHLPKLPIPAAALVAAGTLLEAVAVAEAAEAAVDTMAEAAVGDEVAALPVTGTTLPWSSTSGTAAKSVLMPKTALKASAWAPVFGVWVSAAAEAWAQVFLAVWSAPQLFVRVSQMNWVMISMFWAEPWL